MDWMEQEQEGNYYLTATTCLEDHRINIIDTWSRRLHHWSWKIIKSLDGAVGFGWGCWCRTSVQTVETSDNKFQNLFLNKLDRTGADFYRCVDMSKIVWVVNHSLTVTYRFRSRFEARWFSENERGSLQNEDLKVLDCRNSRRFKVKARI